MRQTFRRGQPNSPKRAGDQRNLTVQQHLPDNDDFAKPL